MWTLGDEDAEWCWCSEMRIYWKMGLLGVADVEEIQMTKDLDADKFGCRKMRTLKDLDAERWGCWKIWMLKDEDAEEDAERWGCWKIWMLKDVDADEDAERWGCWIMWIDEGDKFMHCCTALPSLASFEGCYGGWRGREVEEGEGCWSCVAARCGGGDGVNFPFTKFSLRPLCEQQLRNAIRTARQASNRPNVAQSWAGHRSDGRPRRHDPARPVGADWPDQYAGERICMPLCQIYVGLCAY